MSVEDFDDALRRKRMATQQAHAQAVQCDPPSRPYANAKLFLEARYSHIEHPLLVHQGGEWYRWDRTCWPVFDQGQLRTELYEFFDDAVYPSGDDGPRLFDPSRRKIDDLVDAMRSLVYIPIETQVPSWLRHAVARGPGLPNAHADEIVACSNGLVHVPTRILFPHTPTYYAHHAVPFAFDPAAPPPARWHAFLRDLWGDDEQTIQTLQEIFGYLVSGDTRQQKMFLVVGPRRSGKGTIARVLTAMLGKHHVAGPTLAGIGTNFGLSPLIGKPVAIISDARLGSGDATSVVTERLLSISGEDTLTVDRKYREPWTGQLPSRLVILSNELPRLTDSSGALASRFIILIMTRSFYGRENPDLTKKLCDELPGIFNWALDGLERLRKRGRFQQPAASDDAVREMEDLSSPMGAFVRDCCVLGPAYEVEVDGLYKHWCTWCEDNGRHKTSTQVFGRDLRAVLPGLKVEQPRAGEQRFRRYSGIAIRSGADNSDARVPLRANGAEGGLARDGTRANPFSRAPDGDENDAGTARREGAARPPDDAAGASAERGRLEDPPWPATSDSDGGDPPRGKVGFRVSQEGAVAAQQSGGSVHRQAVDFCAQCGQPVEHGPGVTFVNGGETLHKHCTDLWLKQNPE